jgi:hypothetical protein
MIYQLRRNQAEDLGNGQTRVFGNCAFTGEEYECIVPTDGAHKFQSGTPAQVAFPKLNLDDREFIISSITPKGWEIFGG